MDAYKRASLPWPLASPRGFSGVKSLRVLGFWVLGCRGSGLFKFTARFGGVFVGPGVWKKGVFRQVLNAQMLRRHRRHQSSEGDDLKPS